MIVAVDVSTLTSGHRQRGTGRYTAFLLNALKKQNSDISIREFKDAPNTVSADVVFYPYFEPFFLTLPLRKFQPTVVTVHDLIPIAYPEHFPKGIKGSIKWQIQKLSLMGVSWIITDSHSSKSDISRLTTYPEEKISVIYLAPTVALVNGEKLNTDEGFGIHSPYVLFVGDVNWNKNIPNLIRAFGKVLQKNKNMSLVLVGAVFRNESLPEVREINTLIKTLGINSRINRVGFVEDKLLSAFYQNAECLVQPSYHEGFGLPVLDALSLGCITVCSESSSLKEIAGPSILVNPDDPSDIASGINRALYMTRNDREIFRNQAKLWVSKFSWERTAHETVKVFRKVLSAK